MTAPRLVVVGRWTSRRARLVVIGGFVLACLAILGTFLAIVKGLVPWRTSGGLLHPGPFAVLGELVCAGAAFAAQRALWVRSGSVAFHDDRIVFIKGLVTEVPGTDLLSFDDGSPGFVQLDARGRTGFAAWSTTVPTPSEADRTAVLALLAERGVPRRAD